MSCMMCGGDDRSWPYTTETLCPNHGKDYLKHRLKIGLGDTYAERDLDSIAISCYESALSIFPKSTEALHAKSIALIRLNRPNEAIACIDRWLQTDPRSDTAYANKGIVLCMLERYPDAVRCFEIGIFAMTHVLGAYFYYALALYLIGQYQKALENCDIMLQDEPRNKATIKLKKICRNQLGLRSWKFWHR